MVISPKTAVAVLSGGLDSSIALLLAIKAGHQVPLAITFDYGQRAAANEISSASQIARHFGAHHRVFTLPWFKEFSSGLTNTTQDLPKPKLADLSSEKFTERSAKAVWVPNRNGVMLEIGAAFAEAMKADYLITGFNEEEAQTFPDNSIAYLEALNLAFSFSTANRVRIISPTAPLRKTEIVEIGKQDQFPFPLLWSCYEAGGKMCGVCESCMRLKRALSENEVPFDDYFANTRLN